MLDCSSLSSRAALRSAGVLALLLVFATPAAAQISRVGNSKGLLTVPTQGTSICYAPGQSVYLLVGGYGPLYGVFANTTGDFISSFGLGSTNSSTFFGHHPRCVFSPDLNNGNGGFLVIWHQSENGNAPDFLHSVVVAYPTGAISAERVISDNTDGGTNWTLGATVAYSATSQQFLVAWTTLTWNIRGRLVDASGVPLGTGSFTLAAKGAGDSGVRDPSLAWNPSTDEFGLACTGWQGSGGFTSFRRFKATDASASGSVSTFAIGFGDYMGTVAVNTSTNHYIVGWTQIAQGSFRAEFDANGSMIGTTGLISSGLGTFDSLSIAFNPVSGTFLAVGHDTAGNEDAAIELTGTGAPIGTKIIATNGANANSGSYYPRAAGRTDAKEWGMSYARNGGSITSQIIATATSTGPPQGGVEMFVDAPGPGSTITPPFAVAGWAVDTRAANDNGIDTIHIWAVPTNGSAAVFVGIAIPDTDRNDVAQIFGQNHKKSGYGVVMSNLPPGQYTLVFYPHSSVTGAFDYSKVATRSITVNGSVLTQIETPGWGQVIPNDGVGMVVSGYAINLSAPSGSGIDAVHLWAIDPFGIAPPTFLGAATLNQANATAALFGQQFANGGFTLTNATPVSTGIRYVLAYSKNVGAQTFNIARFVGVFFQ